ncbi:TIGR02757 family protein, partial [Flavobacterium franklandianum]
MNPSELKDFLDEKVLQYNTLDFIESDPVQIPHLFSQKEDIEIAGFLSATIAWGNRKMIIKNSHRMMDLMGNAPYDFVMSHTENDLEQLELFVHRTFNGQDFASFIRSLQHVYANHGGLEVVFSKHQETHSMQKSIHEFKKIFFEIPHPHRTQKHISDPLNNSAAKRINMYLRWMIRQDNKGVDLGIWKSISPASLSCPLDVHSGNVARKLGLLTR